MLVRKQLKTKACNLEVADKGCNKLLINSNQILIYLDTGALSIYVAIRLYALIFRDKSPLNNLVDFLC